MIKDKIFWLIKYITIYSIFIVLTLLTKVPGKIFNFVRLFPNFNIIFIFLIISWIDNEHKYVETSLVINQNNFFIFGLIVDTISHLPLGLSSLSLLVSNKITQQFRSYFLDDDNLFYFIRDLGIFLFFYLLIAWFLISFYQNNFYPINTIFTAWLMDVLAGYFMYFLYNKLKNNV